VPQVSKRLFRVISNGAYSVHIEFIGHAPQRFIACQLLQRFVIKKHEVYLRRVVSAMTRQTPQIQETEAALPLPEALASGMTSSKTT